jgi:predicted Zn-dependent protease
MTETIESLYEQSLERYQAGEDAATLIPVFKDLCDRAPRNAAVWTSLAWLYLLENKTKSALKAAQKAVKSDPKAPQARINLALAMLESNNKGVRPHIEAVEEMFALSPDLRQDVEANLQDGLERKPDWPSLKRIQAWLFS